MSQDIPLDDDPAPRRDLLAAALASAIVDVEGIWCPISEGWFRQMPSQNLAGEDTYSCWKERFYIYWKLLRVANKLHTTTLY